MHDLSRRSFQTSRNVLAEDAAFECVEHVILSRSKPAAVAAGSAVAAAASTYFLGPSLAGHPTGRHGWAPGGWISRMGCLSTLL